MSGAVRCSKRICFGNSAWKVQGDEVGISQGVGGDGGRD